MRKKLLSCALSALMVVSMATFNNGIVANAAEKDSVIARTEFDNGVIVEAADDDSTGEEIEIKSQEPIEVTDFENMQSADKHRLSGKAEVDELKVEGFPVTMSDGELMAGTVSDYLTEEGDYHLYGVDLSSGDYLQAQLDTPASADVDYDLYVLDSDFNVLERSEYFTYLNGSGGTLPESVGYIAPNDGTYYVWVLSSVGGSVSQEYTLKYSVSRSYDSREPDEFASQALPFTFGSDGATVNFRNLHSPVDIDWYVITVPSDRNYNKLSITASTQSSNTCSVEVYQNIASDGYFAMQKVGNGGTVSVSTGTYYIRVSNAKSMEEFNENDIQNYSLKIMPVLTATGITITSMSGTEGEKYVTYSGYGTFFRTSTGTVTVTGYATSKDPVTGTTYYAANTPVTIMYYNPYWEENNTPDYAYVYSNGTTDSTGKYVISVSLPNATGALQADSGVSYHYFDLCAIYAFISDNTDAMTYKPIYHFAYSVYHPF